MIIKCYNTNKEYLLFLDIEFNNLSLVQYAGLLFKRIDDETYQLQRSCNLYITTQVCYAFADYTSITNNFLRENGIPIESAVDIIENEFLEGVEPKQLMIISHGVKNDCIVLERAGLNIDCDKYCTFTNARRILKRTDQLSLEALATESGYYLHHAHNAFNDAWAEVSVYTFLRKVEEQEKNECTSQTSKN
jgi:hypothetical protein